MLNNEDNAYDQWDFFIPVHNTIKKEKTRKFAWLGYDDIIWVNYNTSLT